MTRRAVVWGASGGVGRALVAALVASGDYGVIYAGSRAASDAPVDGRAIAHE